MNAIRVGLAIGLGAITLTGGLAAQTANAQGAKQVYVQDGGTSQALESIFIPPMSGAPFTCILHTEWVRAMPDGGTLTLVNQRRIARQSSGRFYQERWILVPKNGPVESQMSHMQVADPVSHTLTTCIPSSKVCSVTRYGGMTSTVYTPAAQRTGPLPNGTGFVANEPLGNDAAQGVPTVGTRIIRNINAWAFGNDRPFSSTREFWFATSLGINLISKVSDPRFGSQSFTVTDLTLGEPDPQLFEVPNGFAVQDERVGKTGQ